MSNTQTPNQSFNSNGTNSEQADFELTDFERSIAQRMMISIRNFCPQTSSDNSEENTDNSEGYCTKGVTQLPAVLAQLITETEVGGVVLFSENIQSHQQVIQLTTDLQVAASKAKNKRPLFIGIDQEGGRVVRLKRENSTAFSGNMAIGATYHSHGDFYAKEVGNIIGKELNTLGINLNFSPDVDINNNPDNPVINIRSFSENPQVVSELGIAMMNAFQQQNVIATLKHFPGHGNTNIDSHTGLPRVDYDRETINRTDLIPFQNAINSADPGMIMTAHIQYPNLDQSKLLNKFGEAIVAPATMSHNLLTKLLREEMEYKGVVITDALNMASISHHFDLTTATAQSLLAGADIALMPYRVSRPLDILGFKYFVREVANRVLKKQGSKMRTLESVNRIEKLKKQYLMSSGPLNSSAESAANSHNILGSKQHRASQKQLAFDSITLLKDIDEIIPWDEKKGGRLHLVVQDKEQLKLISDSLLTSWSQVNKTLLYLTHTIISDYDRDAAQVRLSKADLILFFFSEKRETAVVKGELSELGVLNIKSLEDEAILRIETIIQLLVQSRKLNKKTLVAGMQSPYEMRQFLEFTDAALVAYDPSIYCDSDTNKLVGYAYDAVISVLLGKVKINGELPVSLGG
ncbi:MAG: glycoside hydrolase family 3 protein [Kangiellaceae bacterium]|nr:glycoside hydrolase family 3 protein [Kangiellaceae bacterium]